jgi:hypothetical protein
MGDAVAGNAVAGNAVAGDGVMGDAMAGDDVKGDAMTADPLPRDRDDAVGPVPAVAAGIRMIVPDKEDEAPGGDPVCWAHLLCPECGSVTSEGHRDDCSLN